MSENKVYLGDSVYVRLHDGMVCLTTEYGRGPVDEIFLEPEVFEALVEWKNNLTTKVTQS